MLIIALVLFTVFSIACGLANNMLELWVVPRPRQELC